MTADTGNAQPPRLELPEFYIEGGPDSGQGAYTGFNSLNLQEVYVVEKWPVERSQIARGWGKPIIARLSNGDLLATQYQKRPAAGEEAALCRSKDEGLTWSSPRLLGLPPGRPGQFTALQDGTLILATNRLYRSSDEGETWTPCKVDWRGSDGGPEDHDFGETGGAIELEDGTLICGFFVSQGAPPPKGYVLRSHDGGRTWGDPSFAAAGASETSLIVLPGGKLLGFARYRTGRAGEGGACLGMIESTDQGRTWSPIRPLLGMAQIPGFPVLLPDGRLVLVYGHRQFPFGAQAIASRDQGATWDMTRPIILAWFSWDSYCGHPRSILMPDGSVMTGYYARVFRGENQNDDIVAHALRWRPPEGWPAGA
ncbi:MAG: sialidase family protein [Candidatus Latescibacterota bacterium]|jgi:hypothetical protein